MPGGPRFHCPVPLAPGITLDLPDGAARHVQVLRLQPGAVITLFGATSPPFTGGEFSATVTAMGRQSVQVLVGGHYPVEREAGRALHLAIGIPANERMDWLVEKATELGVATIQPLMTERTVVRLDAQRAAKKQTHWQSIAVAASEQCGRNRVPVIHPVLPLARWFQLRSNVPPQLGSAALVLSLQPQSHELRAWIGTQPGLHARSVTFLCGPEGGLGPAEENLAISGAHIPVSLGARVLRAETAALAALTLLA
jgi:16S rRNA (uracil1498-N3)-methyltransferase